MLLVTYSIMYFEIIEKVTDVETIAVGSGIRDIGRLQKRYGVGRWRKLRGSWHRQEKNETQTDIELTTMERQRTEQQFAICIENNECEDLELRKIYQILPDESASKDGYIRVIDESGEDYLYPQNYLVLIELPQKAMEALSIPSKDALTLA